MVALVTVAAALLSLSFRLGRVQAAVDQLVHDSRDVAAKLAVHEVADERLFRDMAATLNQIVGKLESR